MHKRTMRVVVSIVVALLVAALAMANSATNTGVLSTSQAIGAAPHQGPTPTPEVAGRSEPGSTDALLWTTMAIAVIVLLPVVTRRSLWH